jgi:hypothetical protein
LSPSRPLSGHREFGELLDAVIKLRELKRVDEQSELERALPCRSRRQRCLLSRGLPAAIRRAD